MAEASKIQWTEHTGGPWLGCTCVSAGCANCYAKDLAETRHEHIFRNAYAKADIKNMPVWGRLGVRVKTKGFWKEMPKYNAVHEKAGTRGRTFPSLIDWLDSMMSGCIDQDGNPVHHSEIMADFLALIHRTPHLDWLLLTKRPQNWEPLMKSALMYMSRSSEAERYPIQTIAWLQAWVMDGRAPHNVWIGVSAENQRHYDERWPELCKIPAVVRFLSCEPLLGEIDLKFRFNSVRLQTRIADEIHWVIVGGESGRNARECDIAAMRSILNQCLEAQVKCFVKQFGSLPRINGLEIPILDRKGGDPSEWPEDMRVRQIPELIGGMVLS